jgi:hypothetical protein
MPDKRVAILGGGILGCSIFALLSGRPGLEVKLCEAGRSVGGGSTAKNHGRNHCGATGVFSDPEEVTARKMDGNRYLRVLPGFSHSKRPGVYRCMTDVDPIPFRLEALARRIDISDLDKVHAARKWLKPCVNGSAFSVPEFALSPAEIAYELYLVGLRHRGTFQPNFPVESVRRQAGKLYLKSSQKDETWADFVINASSKYVNTVKFENRQPLVDLVFHRWPVMAIQKTDLPRPSLRRRPTLDHVLTVVDREKMFPSVIPHKEWFTFDCKTEPEEVDGPSAYPPTNPGLYNPKNAQECHIFEVTRSVFKPLDAIPEHEFALKVKVFYGIHGRRKGPPADSDLSQVFEYPDLENYLVRQGGLATTALLDAIETADEVESRIGASSPPSHRDRLRSLVEGLLETEKKPGMIYEGSEAPY